jgi:cytoskeletal protein CcmA (bactofilin family)
MAEDLFMLLQKITTRRGKMIGGKKNNDIPASVSVSDEKYTLGERSEFEGKLKFEGTVRIDGRFKGEIHSSGTLIIGEKAVVEGDIDVGSCVIVGRLDGNVSAQSKLELHTPAVVSGNIVAPVLVIQEGVTFDGSCRTSGGAQGPKGGIKKPSSMSEQSELIN